MKCAVDIKVTILDGEEKGRTFSETQLCDTETRYEEYGVIDQLRIEWNHIRDWESWKGMDNEQSRRERQITFT